MARKFPLPRTSLKQWGSILSDQITVAGDSLKQSNFGPGFGIGVAKDPGDENRPEDRPAQFRR
jgi:hypothetical protein